eukprot:scaffold34887_cov61-Phaeocystis_antarctica.AAC.2
MAVCSAESCHCERQACSTSASGNASGLVRARRLHARVAISSSAQKPSHSAVCSLPASVQCTTRSAGFRPPMKTPKTSSTTCGDTRPTVRPTRQRAVA